MANTASLFQPQTTLNADGTAQIGSLKAEQPDSILTGQFGGSALLKQAKSSLAGNFGGSCSVSQPVGELSLDGEFPVYGRARFKQPTSTLDASGVSGSVGTAKLTQPRPTLRAYDGGRLQVVSPGHALVVEATFGATGRLRVSQPRTVLTASGTRENTGQARLEQPSSSLVPTGLVLLEQPRAQLAASGGEEISQYVYAAYAVNLRTSGVTEFTDYPFRRIVEFNGEYYGVGPQGVFRIEGSTDAGTVIKSVIETARPDFGSSLFKRVTNTYLLIDTADVLHLSPVTGDGQTHRRKAIGSNRSGMHTRRTQFGKGLKARNWGVKIEHEGEDRFTLQDVEMVGEVLSRKVGG